jgi:hypothetical protein
MEILRVPPYNTQGMIDVEPSTEYTYTVEDMVDHSVTTNTATSNVNGKLIISLPSQYDGEYKVVIEDEDIEEYFNVVRPYIDPTTKGTTASEIAEYAKQEEIARAVIDSVIPEGFYYRKKILDTTGLGADYLPLWVDAKKILSVRENNVLVYEAANESAYPIKYEITKDKSAITISYDGLFNRSESAPNILPASYSDLIDAKFMYRGFVQTFDYSILLAVGYNRIPSDIVRATEILIDEIACGKLEYYTRYVNAYDTDQFKLKFDGRVFEGTGNIIVDKILSKYAKSIRTVGVL